MKKIDSLIDSQTKEFVVICHKFIKYLDTLPDKKISDFWVSQMQMLSGIYKGIFNLPPIETRYEADVEKFVTEKEYNNMRKKLAEFIGPLDKFPDFNDMSHPGSLKIVEVSLAEMLTDIYQDLKDFVKLYETGSLENMNDAIAECYESFGQYWGIKLLTSLRIIHVNHYQQRYAESKKAKQLDMEIEEIMDDSEYEEE